MIEFPRSLARDVWAVLRRCGRSPSTPRRTAVEFHADADGLRVRAWTDEVAVEYRHPSSSPAATITIPADVLAAAQGRDATAVTLEPGGDARVLAFWADGGVPQAVEYDVGDLATLPEFPAPPDRFVTNPTALLAALGEAVRTAAAQATRYALNRLLLRGGPGEVVATDGRQLLVQGGFTFGWAEDLLIPSVPALGGRELGRGDSVEVGRTADRVVVRTGGWTLFVRIDADARFPDVDAVVPKLADSETYCRIAPADAAALAATLPRLPGRDDEDAPVTLDMNGRLVVRASALGQGRTTEVELARSETSGPPVRLCLNRRHLARAIGMGLADLYVARPDKPVLLRDDRRAYVVMPLPTAGALPPAADALRVESVTPDRPVKIFHPARTAIAMSTPSTNGHDTGRAPSEAPNAPEAADATGSGIGALITDAQTLRDEVRGLAGRVARLVTGLKRHCRQSRLVTPILASL